MIRNIIIYLLLLLLLLSKTGFVCLKPHLSPPFSNSPPRNLRSLLRPALSSPMVLISYILLCNSRNSIPSKFSALDIRRLFIVLYAADLPWFIFYFGWNSLFQFHCFFRSTCYMNLNMRNLSLFNYSQSACLSNHVLWLVSLWKVEVIGSRTMLA